MSQNTKRQTHLTRTFGPTITRFPDGPFLCICGKTVDAADRTRWASKVSCKDCIKLMREARRLELHLWAKISRAAKIDTGSRYSAISRDYGGAYSSQRQELVEGAIAYRAWRPQISLYGAFICHWEIGKAYYLRTVTHIITGRLCAISKAELVVDQSARIADRCLPKSWFNTGRYADAMASGEFSEIEPYPADWKVIVNRAALIDAAQWPHELPSKQK